MHTRSAVAFLFALATALFSFPALSRAVSCATDVQAQGGAKTVSAVELYTSEGCDSCPPMDKWFSTLSFKKDGAVPLAFHVDYWDYIGWKDRFAKASFAERQRAQVTLQGSRTVYTPQVLLNGEDARGDTSHARLGARILNIAAQQPNANLKVHGRIVNDAIEATASVDFAAPKFGNDAALYFAISENNLTSRVTAGENRGVTLVHDHVVRDLGGPLVIAPLTEIKRVVALPKDWKRQDLNLVAFVQNTRSGKILQAISVPLCSP